MRKKKLMVVVKKREISRGRDLLIVGGNLQKDKVSEQYYLCIEKFLFLNSINFRICGNEEF